MREELLHLFRDSLFENGWVGCKFRPHLKENMLLIVFPFAVVVAEEDGRLNCRKLFLRVESAVDIFCIFVVIDVLDHFLADRVGGDEIINNVLFMNFDSDWFVIF